MSSKRAHSHYSTKYSAASAQICPQLSTTARRPTCSRPDEFLSEECDRRETDGGPGFGRESCIDQGHQFWNIGNDAGTIEDAARSRLLDRSVA
jgi:hypothetical protein